MTQQRRETIAQSHFFLFKIEFLKKLSEFIDEYGILFTSQYGF